MSVYVYKEGLPGWTKKGYPTESTATYPATPVHPVSGPALQQMMRNEQAPFVIDIRDRDDISQWGTVAGSVHICLDELIERSGEIPRDRDIVIIDLHGKQAKIAARYLASKGARGLSFLEGGFVKGWADKGYPIQRE